MVQFTTVYGRCAAGQRAHVSGTVYASLVKNGHSYTDVGGPPRAAVGGVP